MAQIIGKKLVCDRCNTEVFLKCTETQSLDGGFTKQNIYEKPPNGWGVGILINKSVDLCPECREVYKRMCERFFEEGRITRIYHENGL